MTPLRLDQISACSRSYEPRELLYSCNSLVSFSDQSKFYKYIFDSTEMFQTFTLYVRALQRFPQPKWDGDGKNQESFAKNGAILK